MVSDWVVIGYLDTEGRLFVPVGARLRARSVVVITNATAVLRVRSFGLGVETLQTVGQKLPQRGVGAVLAKHPVNKTQNTTSVQLHIRE